VGDTKDDNTPERTVWCIDLRASSDAAVILDEVDRLVAEKTEEPVTSSGRAKGAESVEPTRIEEAARPRWYPVIDLSRCQNCLECLNFCLFGVFGVDESGQLFLEQPDACRDGCPACARVCPSEAIMFPSHSNPGIAGDPAVSPSQSAMNLVQLFGAPSSADVAGAERDQALNRAATVGRAPETPSPTESKTDQPNEKDEFDDLVDQLDEMEF
jgi:ferredoxin